MKKFKNYVNRIVVCLLILLFIMGHNRLHTFGATSHQFTDIRGNWAEETLTYWLGQELIYGYNDGTFKPNQSISRVEFIILLNRLVEPTDYDAIDFRDVDVDSWYYEDLAKAVSQGYLKGYTDNTLRPFDPITREEVAAIVYRITSNNQKEGIDILKQFDDYEQIANWSQASLAYMVSKGYIKGYTDNTLEPKKDITRVESVVMLNRVYGLYEDKEENKDFKVVGYYSYWADKSPAELNYSLLTHINYAFAVPLTDGTIAVKNPERLKDLVREAHKENVKVYIALGGWGYDSEFNDIAKDPNKLTTFLNSTMAIVDQYNVDGVDMDWEYPDSGTEPENFVHLMKQLKNKLTIKEKGLSAAIIAGVSPSGAETYAASQLRDEIMDIVDWLNIMVYDGQYGGASDHHSSYSFAVNALDYWINKRNFSAHKLLLGVPFYGRTPEDQSKTYKSIIEEDETVADNDFSNGYYYNGLTTMKNKTRLALNEAGGIMIWEISQDTEDETSLLKAIHDTISLK